MITGGSSGLGLATARRFVDEGAHVFITGRRQSELDRAKREIGRNVTTVPGDAANLDDLDRLYETVAAERGVVDVVFANAGFVELVPIDKVTPEHFDKTVGINLRGLSATVCGSKYVVSLGFDSEDAANKAAGLLSGAGEKRK